MPVAYEHYYESVFRQGHIAGTMWTTRDVWEDAYNDNYQIVRINKLFDVFLDPENPHGKQGRDYWEVEPGNTLLLTGISRIVNLYRWYQMLFVDKTGVPHTVWGYEPEMKKWFIPLEEFEN